MKILYFLFSRQHRSFFRLSALEANLIKTFNRIRCRQNQVFTQPKNFTLTNSAAR